MTAGRPVPRGVVALLLGDVVASSTLWEEDAARMAAAVAEMSRLVDETVRRHGGVRPTEQGEGDSFVAAFERASDAVLAALELRDSLEPTGLQLRMAVHAGQVLLRDERNYAGPTINRAARLRDLGHGGQILVSKVTADLARDGLPSDVGLRDLGGHELRGLDAPEHVFQLDRGPAPDFPPLRSAAPRLSNQPAELTSFVGRHQELTDLDDLVTAHRLVTLLGSGGCGKTRLATRFASVYGERWRDGTRFVDLSAATTSLDVDRTIAGVLGVIEVPGVALIETVARHLSGVDMLLIVDNCEQVIAAAAATTDAILQRCDGVRVLATSREPLNVAGESTYRIPPLDVADAVALFVDRARAIRRDFALDDANRDAVDEIVQQLDGIPLAIELAAGRINVLSPEQIATGLSDRFRLLSRGSRTALPRQQTLHGSVSWSYDLLSAEERALLQRLSVFVGGCDLEAAVSVCAVDPLTPDSVLDVVASLVDRSLVLAEDAGSSVRYRLLETIRQFAAAELAATGAAETFRNRHADYFVAFTARVWRLADRDQVVGLRRVTTDLENVYAAIDWGLTTGRVDDALRIAGNMWGYWASQGRFIEGRIRLDAVVGAAGPDTDRTALAAGLFAQSWIQEMQGDYTVSSENAERGLEIARSVGDRRLEGRCLARVGLTQAGLDYVAGAPKLQEAIDIARATGDNLMLILCSNQLGWFRGIAEGPNAARPVLLEARDLTERHNDVVNRAQAEVCLGYVELSAGNLHIARDCAEKSRVVAASTGNGYYEAVALWCLSSVELCVGDVARAVELSNAADAVMPPGHNFATGAGHAYRADVLLHSGDAAAAVEAARLGISAAHVFGPWARELWRINALTLMARGYDRLGDQEAAREAIDAALQVARTANIVVGVDVAKAVAAGMARRDGDPGRASELAADALELERRTGMYGAAADLLELVAALAADDGDDRAAARLAGAASRHRITAGVAGRWTDAVDPAVLDAARERLGDEAFREAWSAGKALAVEDAIDLVLRGRGPRKRPAAGWASLTPTEQRVVELAGEGLSNPEIAQQLFVSRRTVDAHLTHVYAKLGLSSRAELIAAAARRTGKIGKAAGRDR